MGKSFIPSPSYTSPSQREGEETRGASPPYYSSSSKEEGRYTVNSSLSGLN